MRILGWVLLAVMVVACGPSAAQVKTAREARYTAPAIDLFEEVEEAVKGDYKLAQSDLDRLAMITEERWFNREGASESGNSLSDGAYMVQFLVELADENGAVRVTVTPIVQIIHQGQTQLEQVSPTSPKLPGWVSGRVDSIYLAIHGRLKDKAIVAGTP